jgi:hypothetical protein
MGMQGTLHGTDVTESNGHGYHVWFGTEGIIGYGTNGSKWKKC